jgi:hypothetical protein
VTRWGSRLYVVARDSAQKRDWLANGQRHCDRNYDGSEHVPPSPTKGKSRAVGRVAAERKSSNNSIGSDVD